MVFALENWNLVNSRLFKCLRFYEFNENDLIVTLYRIILRK